MNDRLSAWLDEQERHWMFSSARKDSPPMLRALRAVVELHTPTLGGLPPSAIPRCAECKQEWPCPTRRAIEKKVLDD
jgi:hypothetical protein